MTEINGGTVNTINTAADTYKISYVTHRNVDICNMSGAEIYVNTTGDFESNDEYFVIPDGSAYNNYVFGSVDKATLYVKVNASGGKISIVCRKY